MKTGVIFSNTRKCITTIATMTGSIAIIGLSAAFVTNDFGDILRIPFLSVQAGAVTALEPIRSDPASEPNGDNNIIGSDDIGAGSTDIIDGSKIDDEVEPDHALPCLDPNCPIHSFGSGDDLSDDSLSEAPPLEISMNTVRFLPDSCEYVDEIATLSVLESYVDMFGDYFAKYPNSKIYLVGGIAKTADWSITDTELSEKRAETVLQSFVKLGVDADKLVAMGVGVSDPWRSDEWSKGYFDKETAKLNRRVWVIPDQFKQQINIIISVDAMIEEAREAE